MSAVPNAQYNVAAPDSLAIKVATRARRRMFETFLERCNVQADETVMDIGATSDQTYEASNYLEAWYPLKHKVTAVGIDDASFLEQRYPGMTFKQANGLDLPFGDDSFDVVHSSAVLEHVGNEANQRKFIREMVRVARRAVFFTTPNRWFPVEFHSVLPLVHWLPKRQFRRLLAGTSYDFFSKEENLNLLSTRDLRKLCTGLPVESVRVEGQRLWGVKSNLLVSLHKRSH
jgi:ubiquinone/menaquinone biosynthesis C-methylase UbiE